MHGAQAFGFGDAAVTPHGLATQAAMEMLALGGSAVDAAVAADAVLGVVAPETCGIGGDLFALVHAPGLTSPRAINASGRAGSGADADLLWDAGHRVIPPFHHHTVTIPGCVDGWQTLLEAYGRLNVGQVLAPAIRLATEGFPVSFELAVALSNRQLELANQPSGMPLYPDGRPPAPGERLVRMSLAHTLRQIVEGGRQAFYLGSPGQAITEAVGEIITSEDLARSQAEWVEPVKLEVFGLTGWTTPPNSQGYLTLAGARVFEMLDPPSNPNDPLWWHLLIEAFRSVAWDRNEVLADPETSPLSGRALVDDSRLEARARSIDVDRAGWFGAPNPVSGGTAYLCVLDREGVGVSFIQSNYMGIGSGIGCGGAGFFLHNRGAGFDLRPGHPNRLAPGRRPLHTLSPSLWTRDGRLTGLLGTRGGDYQPQLLLQMAAAMFKAGTGPAEAMAHPRWVIDRVGQEWASEVKVEATTPHQVVTELTAKGHHVITGSPFERGWGPVSVITVDDDGLVTAAADDRVSTTSAAVR